MSDGPRKAATSFQPPSSPSSGNDREEESLVATVGDDETFSSWNRLFHQMTLSQKESLFQSARKQGCLSFDQLPPPDKAIRSESEPPWLQRVLAGLVNDLEPVALAPLFCADKDLDQTQQRAVALALNSPDICLIQGCAGTGKSRVIAEIIHQAILKGERVLFLAPWSSSLDSYLLGSVSNANLSPLRLVELNNKPEELPQNIRPFTSEERLRSLKEQTAPQVRLRISELESALGQIRSLEERWPRLFSLARHHLETSERIAAHDATSKLLESSIIGDLPALEKGHHRDETQGKICEDLKACQSKVGALDIELRNLQAIEAQEKSKAQELDAQLKPLAPLLESKSNGRFWQRAWWQATFNPTSVDQAKKLQAQLWEANQALQEVTKRLQECSVQSASELERLEVHRKTLIQHELACRQAEAAATASQLQAALNDAQEQWRQTIRGWPKDVRPPAVCHADAIISSQASWKENLALTEACLRHLREWLTFIEGDPKAIDAWLGQSSNLILASLDLLPTHPFFAGDSAAVNFDLLILEGSQELTEAAFVRIAKLAHRCVLVGEPPLETTQANAGQKRHHASAAARTPASKHRIFQRLWNQFHWDPRKLPYRWHKEQGRPCCRLQEVKSDQRHWLETERVADHQDIELRILAMPRKAPALAEVVFPSSWSIAQAKSYIFSELQELAVQAGSSNVTWRDHDEHVSLVFVDGCTHEVPPINLADGIREHLQGLELTSGPNSQAVHAQTCCLQFDRKAGWHKTKAEEWVVKYLGLKDLSRTICLEKPYRMHPALARFISALLSQETSPFSSHLKGSVHERPNGSLASVADLVPIRFFSAAEALDLGGARQTSGAGSLVEKKHGGAATTTLVRNGRTNLKHEIDLADPSQRLRLPQGMSACLPKSGLVNYEEAQRVVHVLESIVNDFEGGLRRGESHPNANMPAIGIMALYQGQVELIRRLMEQVPSLVASPISVLVDEPSGFRDKECSIALLSLTRNHSHRTTSFGGDPSILALALTRARDRLFIFGDPATLIRRAQWDGCVESLDEESSGIEQGIVKQLIKHLGAQGADQHSFQTQLGGWT